MVVIVEFIVAGELRPAVGTPVLAQVRDVTMTDAAAVVVGSGTGTVSGTTGSWIETVEVVLPEGLDVSRDYTVWGHVDSDDSGDTTDGDFITMQSYPVPVGEPEVRIQVVVNPI